MYTTYMPTLSSLPVPGNIVIDWSEVVKSQQTGLEVDEMIAWVKGYPEAKKVHVYLSTGRKNGRVRLLQNKLLCMGCRVTVK